MGNETNTVMQAYQIMMQGEHAQAMQMFQRLLEEGNAEANYYLGYMHEKGWGVTADLVLAERYYQARCETDFRQGKRALADMYQEQKNFQAAVDAFAELAEYGDASATYWAYTLYDVELRSPSNQIKADAYLQKAANLGNVFAQRDLHRRHAQKAKNIFVRLWHRFKFWCFKLQCAWAIAKSRQNLQMS